MQKKVQTKIYLKTSAENSAEVILTKIFHNTFMSKSNASKAEVLQYMQNEQKNDKQNPQPLKKAGGSINFKLLRGAFFEAFALLDCLAFADFLLHHCAHFQRQAEKRDESLRVLVVVQVAGFETRDAFVVEAVF